MEKIKEKNVCYNMPDLYKFKKIFLKLPLIINLKRIFKVKNFT